MFEDVSTVEEQLAGEKAGGFVNSAEDLAEDLPGAPA